LSLINFQHEGQESASLYLTTASSPNAERQSHPLTLLKYCCTWRSRSIKTITIAFLHCKTRTQSANTEQNRQFEYQQVTNTFLPEVSGRRSQSYNRVALDSPDIHFCGVPCHQTVGRQKNNEHVDPRYTTYVDMSYLAAQPSSPTEHTYMHSIPRDR